MARTFESDSSNASRALQIHLILIGAAKRRETLTYEMLAEAMGWGRHAAHVLANKLDPLMRWCKANGLPALTSIVVDKNKGIPNIGLTTVEGDDFPAEQQKCFEFDWFSIFPPTVVELSTKKREAA